MNNPHYDLVVFGATSFVGQILCGYLMDQFGVDGTLAWAAAGRSQAKLDSVIETLGAPVPALPTLVADAADEVALKAMCQQTSVVVSTVGPYALYGEPLVKACVETGTDYCDITGEAHWIRRMIDRYEAQAIASGARIVHCCGFDSIPSDLGVYLLQQQARKKFGSPCTRVKMRVKALRGEFSGGTVASMINVAKEAVVNPALRTQLADPYSICPPDSPRHVSQPSVNSVAYDSDFDSWAAPFVMAAINTRVVHRSNALFSQAYGEGFQYDEAMLTGKGAKGWASGRGMTAGMGGFMLAAAFKPSRWVLERFVMPLPGEGPGPEAREKGFYDLRFFGSTAAGETLRTKVSGDRDPGYGSSAKMLGQAGVCLAKDLSHEEKQGGFWTPATLFGDRLVARLERFSGLRFAF